MKKKYVIAGTGNRGIIAYLIPLTKEYTDCAEVVGLYDINTERAEVGATKAAYPVPVFSDFDEMLRTTRPDTVIVSTKDSTHDEYAIKALDFGCDVICEKPLTTTAEKFKAIYAAERRSGKKLTTTFNCRFMPNFMRVKQIIMNGEIGDILSAHFDWFLDLTHGASYFRRWNRRREESGTLLVHKASHHFDLLNWFLADEPEKINAFGSLKFYGPTRKERGERCFTCPHKNTCEFFYDVTKDQSGFFNEIYQNCRSSDGYTPDRCVFDDEINIEDSASVSIRYKKGTVVSYTLSAYSPYEGMNLVLNGTKGRLELKTYYSGDEPGCTITIYEPSGEKRIIIPSQRDSRGHGSADVMFRDAMFRGLESDPMNQVADSRAAAMSIGIGFAATTSMDEDRAVEMKELFEDL